MEPDIRYWVEQGKEFLKNNAFKKAEQVFLKVISAKHEFADVYNMMGVINHQTGQLEDAIGYFKKALSINPRYTEAMLNLSVLYNDVGEYKLAKDLVNKFKKESKKGSDQMDPYLRGKLANKHAEVGDLYRGLGLFAKAAGEYGRALELSPTYYDIRIKLGVSLREQGKKAEALKEFQKIIKEKPSYTEAQIQTGITLYTLGKIKEAKTVWEKLAKTNPGHQMVRTYLRMAESKKK